MEIELESTKLILVSRNKLIEDLLVEIPKTREDFAKAMKMRSENWAKDAQIWEEVRRSNGNTEV